MITTTHTKVKEEYEKYGQSVKEIISLSDYYRGDFVEENILVNKGGIPEYTFLYYYIIFKNMISYYYRTAICQYFLIYIKNYIL
jgi:hypothetical protein